MRYSEGGFYGAGGMELHYRRWLPDADPRAVVALVHGVCEHGGRYTNVVDRLAWDGYAVYAYDLCWSEEVILVNSAARLTSNII